MLVKFARLSALAAMWILLSTGTAHATPIGYSFCYQAHVYNLGWLNWVCDGQVAGTVGQNRRMEALNFYFNAPTTTNFTITVQAQLANSGWQAPVTVGNGQLGSVGTVGQQRAMEAITLKINNPPAGVHICYTAQVQNIGWQGWVCDGAIAGTVGQGLQIEAIEVEFTP